MATQSIEIGERELHIGPEQAGMLVGWSNVFTDTPWDCGAVLTFAQVGEDGAYLSLPRPDGNPLDIAVADEGFNNAVTLVAFEKRSYRPYINLHCWQSSREPTRLPRSVRGGFGAAVLASQTAHHGHHNMIVPAHSRGAWGFGAPGIVSGLHRQLNTVKASVEMRNRLYYAAAYHASDEALLVAPAMNPQTAAELERATVIHRLLREATTISTDMADAVKDDPSAWPEDVVRQFGDSRRALLAHNLQLLGLARESALVDPYLSSGFKGRSARHRYQTLVFRNDTRSGLSDLGYVENKVRGDLHQRDGGVSDKLREDANVFTIRLADSAYILGRLGRLAEQEVQQSA